MENFPPNIAMISRIERAMANGRELTTGERNFLVHELTEIREVEGGMPQELAHQVAGRTHPVFQNYDPQVILEFPEHFNANWRKAWGIL
ncbi:hypothetical protein SAMN05444157_3086 [Frankineae bacterium MT45]|nr:hypothetical protein SAMN05444157_3086 [Frankineae bacterium MT45]